MAGESTSEELFILESNGVESGQAIGFEEQTEHQLRVRWWMSLRVVRKYIHRGCGGCFCTMVDTLGIVELDDGGYWQVVF